MSRSLGFNTMAVRGGYEPDKETRARAVPIYQTTSYTFTDSHQAARLFDLEEPGHIYTRISNPTTEVLETRVAALEGGTGALAVSSGQAAIALAVLNIVSQGDNIVASSSLYGGTHNLLSLTLPRFGIKTVFCDPSKPQEIMRAVDHRTRLLFAETIGNPRMDVSDLEMLSQIAHQAGIPFVVDNTLATPYLCQPLEHGADIVVHSATKFIGGHGTSIGGIIVDGGKFDWQSGSFSLLTDPDPSYHGLKYVDSFGPAAYITKARAQLLRDLGPCLSPFNSFLLLQGLETLSLRMDRHSANAHGVASFLSDHPRVSWVRYPGLESHPQYGLARRYLPRGAGAVVTFGVRGGLKAGMSFIERLSLFSHLANVGDARSLVIHPASTTHRQLGLEDREMAGISDDLIRLSVGLEDLPDLLADLQQALG